MILMKHKIENIDLGHLWSIDELFSHSLKNKKSSHLKCWIFDFKACATEQAGVTPYTNLKDNTLVLVGYPTSHHNHTEKMQFVSMPCLSRNTDVSFRLPYNLSSHAVTYASRAFKHYLMNARRSRTMFYSCYQGYTHSWAIVFLCKPPVQVWLGLDNRKYAWRGDTTLQDVIEAIIMLSRRDVQELVTRRLGGNTPRFWAWRDSNVSWCCEFWKARSAMCESRHDTGGALCGNGTDRWLFAVANVSGLRAADKQEESVSLWKSFGTWTETSQILNSLLCQCTPNYW